MTQAEGSFFSPAPGSEFDLMNLEATNLSDAFLFEQGFTVAWLGWQFDLPKGAMRMDAPAANVNGLVRQSAIALSAGSRLWRLGGTSSYCAADAAQPDAQLLVKSHFDDPGRVLPREAWRFADPCTVVLEDGFEAGQVYELIYRGVNPALAGLGEAAVSDFVSWLKYGGVAYAVARAP